MTRMRHSMNYFRMTFTLLTLKAPFAFSSSSREVDVPSAFVADAAPISPRLLKKQHFVAVIYESSTCSASAFHVIIETDTATQVIQEPLTAFMDHTCLRVLHLNGEGR